VGTCVFVRLLGLQIKGLVIGSAVVAVPFAVPHVESAHMFLVEVTRVVNAFWLDLLY
jgi:ABC-type molybdate transport system permease subunit